MAGQERNMEGDANQKRKAAREARAEGKKPSEMSATTGASKQRKKAPSNASHQEKMALKKEGKSSKRMPGEDARPGNRETDPKREGDRWG